MAQQTVTNSIGLPFIELQTVDSTNKYAMELVHAGMAQHGTTILTHEQTAGKGQRSKKWASEAGANIAMSMIIRPVSLQLHEQFYLSAAVALAVHQFFSKYAGDEVKIKWPNDLYWCDRKAGGILIESVIGSSASVKKKVTDSSQSIAGSDSLINAWQWAVIGIGININQTSFSNDLPNPVSLKQITGKKYEPILLAKELCSFINEEFNSLLAGNKQIIIQRYNQVLYQLNKPVKLKKENRVFDVTIKGVSSSGKLLTTHAFDEEFNFGEVEWVIEKVK